MHRIGYNFAAGVCMLVSFIHRIEEYLYDLHLFSRISCSFFLSDTPVVTIVTDCKPMCCIIRSTPIMIMIMMYYVHIYWGYIRDLILSYI